MGKGRSFGSVVGPVCAVCASSTAFGSPDLRAVQPNVLIPDTNVQAQVNLEKPKLAMGVSVELEPSMKRMLRLGFAVEDMHAIPVSRVGFRYGLPVDEQASRDDRVNLSSSGSIAAGTLVNLVRDERGFRDFAGRQMFREDGVPGLKLFPFDGHPLHVGFGVMVSVDKKDDKSQVFGRPYLALAQVGFRF